MDKISKFDFKRLFRDGSAIALFFSLYVCLTIYWNPYLWIGDYPGDIQSMVSDQPEMQLRRLVLGLGMILVLLGLSSWSTINWIRDRVARVKFSSVAVYLFLLFQIVNLWDLIVIDWLIFTAITPDFIIIPGTEGAKGYDDYWFHLKAGYLAWEPWVGIAGLSILTALPIYWMTKKRSIKNVSGVESD